MSNIPKKHSDKIYIEGNSNETEDNKLINVSPLKKPSAKKNTQGKPTTRENKIELIKEIIENYWRELEKPDYERIGEIEGSYWYVLPNEPQKAKELVKELEGLQGPINTIKKNIIENIAKLEVNLEKLQDSNKLYKLKEIENMREELQTKSENSTPNTVFNLTRRNVKLTHRTVFNPMSSHHIDILREEKKKLKTDITTANTRLDELLNTYKDNLVSWFKTKNELINEQKELLIRSSARRAGKRHGSTKFNPTAAGCIDTTTLKIIETTMDEIRENKKVNLENIKDTLSIINDLTNQKILMSAGKSIKKHRVKNNRKTLKRSR